MYNQLNFKVIYEKLVIWLVDIRQFSAFFQYI